MAILGWCWDTHGLCQAHLGPFGAILGLYQDISGSSWAMWGYVGGSVGPRRGWVRLMLTGWRLKGKPCFVPWVFGQNPLSDVQFQVPMPTQHPSNGPHSSTNKLAAPWPSGPWWPWAPNGAGTRRRMDWSEKGWMDWSEQGWPSCYVDQQDLHGEWRSPTRSMKIKEGQWRMAKKVICHKCKAKMTQMHHMLGIPKKCSEAISWLFAWQATYPESIYVLHTWFAPEWLITNLVETYVVSESNLLRTERAPFRNTHPLMKEMFLYKSWIYSYFERHAVQRLFLGKSWACTLQTLKIPK